MPDIVGVGCEISTSVVVDNVYIPLRKFSFFELLASF
jgi:hypothetical protein